MALITIGRSSIISVRESTFPAQWAEQKERYSQLRGFDVGRDNKAIPRTTLADAVDLLDYWGRQGEQSTHADAKRWREFSSAARLGVMMAEVLPGNNATTVYPDNQALWDGLQRRATDLASTTAIPTRWELASEAIGEAVVDVKERAADVARFIWPEWATKALKFGGIGLGAALGIYWISKARK